MRQNHNPKRKQRFLGVLMIVMALVIMQLPVSEVDAAASTSDFRINGSTLVKYRGTDKNVTLPSTIEVIGRGAFEDNTNIELVVIPNSVKRIDPYAFWGCSNLDTVVLGQGLSDVGDYAFAGCKGLEQMSIPSNITAIGIEAFADCVNMEDISIPAETVRIHETAFDGCYHLTIHCDAGSVAEAFARDFYERRKEWAEYEDVPEDLPSDSEGPDMATPTPSPTPVEESIVGTTHIVGNQAVFLVDNQKMKVYEGTPESELVNRPLADLMGNGGIPKYAVVDGEIVADQAYYQSTGVGNVVLADGIKEIGEFAFARSTIASLVLPEGTERIAYGAFYHCGSLTNVTLPETIMYVEPKAFSYTPWVENFLKAGAGEGDFLIEGGMLIAYRGSKQSVTIPEGVRVIAAEAFRGHTEIRSVALPDSLLVIGEGAFEGCNQLRRIVFGRNVEEILDRAFAGINPLLVSLSLPASVKKLGLQAFGDIRIQYEGEEPEHTYETTATRLSNEDYRRYDNTEGQTPGVTVTGLEGASAAMEEADRSYTLSVETLEKSVHMEKACMRIFQVELPKDRMIYQLTLTDESNIPLKKLGDRILTVILPLPDFLSGQKLRLLALDRNGQMENTPVERVTVDGVKAIRFRTGYPTQFVLYGTGAADAGEKPLEVEALVLYGQHPEESGQKLQDRNGFMLCGTESSETDDKLLEGSMTVARQAAAPGRAVEGGSFSRLGVRDLLHRPGIWVGSGLLITGCILLLAGNINRKL